MMKTLFITFDEKWLASLAGLFTVDIPPDKYGPVSFWFYTKTKYFEIWRFVEEISFIAKGFARFSCYGSMSLIHILLFINPGVN